MRWTRASFRTYNERPDDEIISAFQAAEIAGDGEAGGDRMVGWKGGRKEENRRMGGRIMVGERSENNGRCVAENRLVRHIKQVTSRTESVLKKGLGIGSSRPSAVGCAGSQGVHMKHMPFAFQNGAAATRKSKISQIIISEGAHSMINGVMRPVNPPPDFRKACGFEMQGT